VSGDVSVKASTFAAIAILFALAVSALAQDARPEPVLALPPSVLGPDLIAWSQMQTPRPVPQPLPPDQNPQAQKQPTGEIFIGTIVKARTTYVLRVQGGTTYYLDDRVLGQDNLKKDNLKKYDGRQVRLIGNLDASCTRLHMVSIEPIS
jgi:hypothetical protein